MSLLRLLAEPQHVAIEHILDKVDEIKRIVNSNLLEPAQLCYISQAIEKTVFQLMINRNSQIERVQEAFRSLLQIGFQDIMAESHCFKEMAFYYSRCGLNQEGLDLLKKLRTSLVSRTSHVSQAWKMQEMRSIAQIIDEFEKGSRP
ncbi:hypothetical protein J0H58_26030 [bacterium]|nr:hypothetical protein [bacterium]